MHVGIGDRVDRYTIEAVIGEGGMGTVYRAHDQRLDRRVALKVVKPDKIQAGGAEDMAAKMLREARAAAALDHPNAVSIFDVGSVDGTVYIAMEFIDGTALRAFVGDTNLAWDKKTRILVDVARALAAAHERGLVHRDVKPENVMVRRDGVVKVLDFGIAKRMSVDLTGGLSTSSTETKTGTIIGTPRYMSPEQVRGEPIDARSDQFAWGVLAYELLSGVSPWEQAGEGVQLLVAVATEPAPPLARLVPDLPSVVEATVKKCMAKQPSERFASMHEVIATLEPYVGGSLRNVTPGPISAPTFSTKTEMLASKRPVTTQRKARPVPRRVPWLATGTALLFAGLGALGYARYRQGEGVVPAASAEARPSATVITALPTPPNTKPEAAAAFRAGLQGLRDAAFESARQAFERAVELDPGFAAAHLRLAVMNARISSQQMDARKAYKTAQSFRANLSERDQVLLDALAPFFQSDPPDLKTSEQRLDAATKRYPDDAEMFYYLAFIRFDRGQLKTSIPAYDRALELDPQFAQAWGQKAAVHLLSGDVPQTERAVDRCLELSPSATECMWIRTFLDDQEGRCADLESTTRRWVTRDPEDFYGYRLLAKALLAQGRPVETVRAVLEQKWSKLQPERRRRAVVADELTLALARGDFAAAEKHAKDFEKLIADVPDATEHSRPALALVNIYDEMGKRALSREVAAAFLNRSDAWLPPTRVEESAILDDVVPTMLGVLVHTGAMPYAEFRAKRAAWIGTWEKKTSEGYVNYLWVNAFTSPAQTPEDAEDAMAALPRYSPLPPFMQGPAQGSVGHAFLLAGKLDEAIDHLGRATRSCTYMDDPVGHTRAHLRLGLAYAARGDKARACANLAVVESRWADAKPRSVTAEAAKQKITQLGCTR